MLVALRLGLGCHFLYEGVWKIKPFEKFSTKHAEPFTAEPFLTQAKGPLAGFFYMMVPDIDGRQRLRVGTDADGKKSIDSSGIAARWNAIRQEFVDYYRPAGSATEAAKTAFERLQQEADKSCQKFQKQLEEYFKENVDDIAAYLGALDRFENDKERQPNRALPEATPLGPDDGIAGRGGQVDRGRRSPGDGPEADLVQPARRRATGARQRCRPVGIRCIGARSEQIDFAVTYGLTAIGVCLMLGFCTRLAALGGAAFMCFVVMTQPAFAGIYPPDPHVVGHALLVNKDFIECWPC